MEEIIVRYLNFIGEEFITDVSVFNNWWMMFVLPAFCWLIVLLMKYWFILFPIWFPAAIGLRLISLIFGNENKPQINNTYYQVTDEVKEIK